MTSVYNNSLFVNSFSLQQNSCTEQQPTEKKKKSQIKLLFSKLKKIQCTYRQKLLLRQHLWAIAIQSMRSCKQEGRKLISYVIEINTNSSH